MSENETNKAHIILNIPLQNWSNGIQHDYTICLYKPSVCSVYNYWEIDQWVMLWHWTNMWPIRLFCILEILCPPPIVPLNGLLIEDSAPGRHVVGSVVQFSCGEKHQLIGKPSMVCTENGTWSHSTPYCEHTYIRF